MDDILTMEDMALVFSVTDEYGIDREEMSVSLDKEDPGSAFMNPSGELEIIIPKSVPLQDWLPTLRGRLEELGFEAEGEED